MRRLRTKKARAALTRAEQTARQAPIPALTAEVESACRSLNTPAARRIARGEDRAKHSAQTSDFDAQARAMRFINEPCSKRARKENISWHVAGPGFA